MTLRIIFAGTAEFAVPSLQALINSSHEVVAVYTQPDRPAGRGQQLKASAIKEVSLIHHLPVLQPASLKSAKEQDILRQFQADLMVVVAYGLLIPPSVLNIFPYGGMNVHPSLLPRWRGAAPIQRAILAGDQMTGVCIMQMDAGLDTGPVLWRETYPLDSNMTSGELHDQLAKAGACALLATLLQCAQGTLLPITQNHEGATYATKIDKQEAEINWQLSAREIHNKIRAFNPWPVAYTSYQKKVLRIWKSQIISENNSENNAAAPPGMIIQASSQGIDVTTLQGQLRLLILQLPGGKPLAVQDFYNGQRSFLQSNQIQLGQ